MNLIEKNISPISNLCREYKVKQLFVFGSVLTDNFKKNSDIDFIVDFQRMDLYPSRKNVHHL